MSVLNFFDIHDLFEKFLRILVKMNLFQPLYVLRFEQMSSSHQYMQNTSTGNSTSRLGEIEHQSQLSENLAALCLSREYSDVTLVVEGQRLYAHKVRCV